MMWDFNVFCYCAKFVSCEEKNIESKCKQEMDAAVHGEKSC